jgi:hypothetical protein
MLKYQDNKQGKESFTKEVIAKVVRQVGYVQADYLQDKEGEKIYLFQDRGNIFYDVVKVIDVTADSCYAMLLDVIKNI